MIISDKILCGSSELFKNVPKFHPGDRDYIIISDSDKVFEHTHPDEETCYFIWGKDKAMVRRYLLEFPYYMCLMSLVTKEFVDHYELSLEDIKKAVDQTRKIYETSTYRYYLPLFDYIISTGSWEFPEEIINKAYELYKEFKKR